MGYFGRTDVVVSAGQPAQSNLGDFWYDTDDTPGFGTGPFLAADEDRLHAIAVTLMRPSKIKLKVGSFGTWVPSERVYARVINLARLGASSVNYMSGHQPWGDEFYSTPLTTSDSVVSHASSAIVVYVTETDVAAVNNAKATYCRMKADLLRSAAVTHYQAEISGSPKTGSTPTTITPGANGSMVLDLEGQGYEIDLLATISGTDHNPAVLATKNAMTADGTANEWGHSWFGRVPLMFPIDGTMDSQTVTWSVKAYSAQVNYAGWCNARVADLPADWDTDE